jgi:hypothetical protein
MDIYSPLVLLTASDGSTVKLQLNSTGTATYSVGGNVWLPISKDRVISGGTISGGEYTFTGGITSVDGTVYLDANQLVPIINSSTSSDKLSAAKLDISAGDGIALVGGKISVKREEFVAESGFEDRVVALIPELAEYEAGSGIAITDNVISLVPGTDAGDVPAIDISGKLPATVIPQILEAGNGIVISGTTISAVMSGGEVAPYVAGEGIEIVGNTIRAVVFEDLR